MKMKDTLKMMVLFVSVLLFHLHFSESFPLKGCVCGHGEPTNTTHLLYMLMMTRNMPTSSSGESGFSHLALIVGVSAFITILLLGISMLKTQESSPGGVLGSLIHYPAHSLGITTNQRTSSV